MTALLTAAVALCAVSLLLQASRYRIPFGKINGRWLRRPPRIDDPRIGRSQGLPFALEFKIGEDCDGFPGGIGRSAHRASFKGLPDIAVSIKYACARPDLLGRSDFADPDSIWFNVFFGYYQIDVDKEQWGRAFAYDAEGRVDAVELARLVRADWNHLSARLYGVPRSAIDDSIDRLGFDDLEYAELGRVRGEGWSGAFDDVAYENVVVVGPNAVKRGDYENPSLASPLWRLSFGTHRSSTAPSFTTCTLRMRAWLSFRETKDASGRAVFRTTVFGGAVNRRYDLVDAAENARFLALQMKELERVLAGEKDLGFVDEDRAADEADVALAS